MIKFPRNAISRFSLPSLSCFDCLLPDFEPPLPLIRIIASWAEYWWGWDVVDHWMMTGEYEWKLPVWGTYIKEKDPQGKPPCDWWGVNYYSRPVLNWHLATTCFPVGMCGGWQQPASQ